MTETVSTTSRALVGNAGDPEQVASADRKLRVNERRDAGDLRALLKHPEFRRFLWRVLGFCGVYGTPFSHDDRTTTLNIGRGEVGRWLIAELEKANPLAYPEMMLAAKREEMERDG